MRALALTAFVLAGCSDRAIFECVDDASCGASGRCEDNGYCSFPDAECASGRRFGEHAPAGVAGRCVDDDLAGTTTSGTATTTATTSVTTIDPDDGNPTTDATSTTSLDDSSTSTGREPTTGPISTSTTAEDSSTTSNDPQPVALGPIPIADDRDDGAIWPDGDMVDAAWFQSGESMLGLAYCGVYPTGAHYYAYLRFVLPEAIPADAVVLAATIEVNGHGTYLWNAESDALRIWTERTTDAEQVQGVDDYPATQALTDASVRWPDAGGLDWNIAGPNVAPDLASLVQEVVDLGGVGEGAAIQFWIGADDLGRGGREVGWIDASHPNAEAARLSVTYFRP